MKQVKYIINDLNLYKQADELGIKVWQTPGFLFLMIGFIASVVMTATFYVSRYYHNPSAVIISESIVASLILTIGTAVVRLVDQVVQVNKMKSEFVSIASHQLRTPLSAIKWETELLLTKFKSGLDEKQLRNIENINQLSERMSRLVNDLLDVTRIEQKRLILKRVPLDLTEIAQEAIDNVLPVTKLRHIELTFNVKKSVPKVIGDPERVKMVMDNLLNNAIKYTTNRGKIEVKVFRDGNVTVCSIKDNGVGIPEEQLDRVFDKFFRSDNAVKYQTEGTGLGLYIAKNIIEQLGGRIWFQSVENLGSIFSFSLPVKSLKKK